MNEPLLNRALPTIMGLDPENIELKLGELNIGSPWVLEWSEAQQAFHVETLVEALSNNILHFYKDGKTGDYIILGVFESREKADDLYNNCIERMKRWHLSGFTPDNLLRDLES